jgi:hypothetical protein
MDFQTQTTYQSPVNRKHLPIITMSSIVKRHIETNKQLPDWLTSSIDWQIICKKEKTND